MNFKHLFSGLSCSLLAASVFATPHYTHTQQTVVAPACFYAHQTNHIHLLAQHHHLSLFSATSGFLDTQKTKLKQQGSKCSHYLNVSEAWNNHSLQQSNLTFLKQFVPHTQPATLNKTNYRIQYPQATSALISTIQTDNLWSNLTKLSDTTVFPDRSAYTEHGVDAAHWIKQQVEAMAAVAGRTDVSAELIPTGGSYLQPSLVVKIGNELTNDAVVVGAHMDTMSEDDWPWGEKPGADDDGTGSVTVLELARVLINSTQRFQHPIYLAWYAAEERGLIGSQVVVDTFIERSIPVKAVLHLDMTGFQPTGDDNKLWLITDNVNADLTDFVGTLATAYAGVSEVGRTSCGYACSDHASWTQGGFISSMPSESDFDAMDPYIHTSDDLMQYLNPNHMTKFIKLATAFVSELAEPA